MAFSYVGNFPNQQVSNSGVLSLDDINNLESTGELGGSLELIEEQTISSAYADFTSLQESKYDVLMFQLEKVTPTTNGHNIGFRFSNNGGTSFISSGYQYAWQRGYPSTFTEIKSTSSDRILANGGIGRLAYAHWTNDIQLAKDEFKKRFNQIDRLTLKDGYYNNNSFRGVRALWYHSMGLDNVLGYIAIAKAWNVEVPEIVLNKAKLSAKVNNLGIDNYKGFKARSKPFNISNMIIKIIPCIFNKISRRIFFIIRNYFNDTN